MLRLPTHATPVAYLVRFRGPRDPSLLRARCCQRSRTGGGPASGRDHGSAGDPSCRCVLAWTQVGSLRFSGDPSCAFAPVYDPGRTDVPSPIVVSSMLPLPRGGQRLQRDVNFEATAGLQHLLSTLHEWCCHHHMQDSLPAGWLAFAGRELNPLDRCERFPSYDISFPFPELILTLAE